ncbi:MAG: response regulator [Flammeovirgaceae bacterium]
MNTPINIALVDDEFLFLEGLTALLANEASLSIVATANGGKALLEQLQALPNEQFPSIILLDIQMKPMDGFELVGILKEKYPDLHIIILSSHYKQAIFGHMIKLGAAAFLPKNASQTLLIEAINQVQATGVFFSPKDHELLTKFVKSKSPKRYFNSVEQLSDREIEVVQLICLEYTNQEIADKLCLSKRTVESHRQRILDKIGAKNTVGLVIYAMAHDLCTPDSKYFY